MTPTARKKWLGIALVGTVLAAALAPDQPVDGAVASAAPRRPVAPQVMPEGERPDGPALLSVTSRMDQPSPRAAFSETSWEPRRVAAQRPSATATPEPPPESPPPPFRLIGRVVDGGVVAAFLEHKGETVVARTGDVLADAYRVERIDSDAVVLTHLPTNSEQVLNGGGT